MTVQTMTGSCFCGGVEVTVTGEPAAMGLTDVYAAILPKLEFKPGLHVFYAETVLHIHDGLPKLKDVPKELGGSGDTLAELVFRTPASPQTRNRR
jgi:hypothetical protein